MTLIVVGGVPVGFSRVQGSMVAKGQTGPVLSTAAGGLSAF